MKRSLLLAAFIAGWTAPALADDPKTVEDYIKLAQQKEADFYSSGGHYRDLEDAVDIYSAILKQYPKEFPEVYYYRAEDYSAAGMERAAIKDYDKALELDAPPPKGPYLKHDAIYKDRGEAEKDVGEYKSAVADFTRAMQSHPNDLELVDDRAEARLGAGDCAGAISDYSSAIELTPAGETPSSLYYDGRAVGRICTGDLEPALEDFRSAIKSEQQLNTQTHMNSIGTTNLNKWVLLTHLGRKADADQELSAELAAADTPKDIDSEYDAARYFLGRADQAVLFSDAEALKKKQPSAAGAFQSDAWYYAGLKAAADGRKAEALKDFHKVLASRQSTMGTPEAAHAWSVELQRHRH
ncbi:MAG: hypothetical protein KGJ75_06910 [Alphaproteobacteria bacterium]|nr:hypothetical protein [Alphaproteobacteria bacterium]